MNLQSNSGATGSLEDASNALSDILKDENKLNRNKNTLLSKHTNKPSNLTLNKKSKTQKIPLWQICFNFQD